MADPFDEHRGKLGNFEDDMVDLCYDIVEASYDTMNAYHKTYPDLVEGIYAAPKDYVASLYPLATEEDFDNEQFHHTKYRDDIAQLANGDLSIFLDDADPSQFDDAIAQLGRASEHLEVATGYTGLEELIPLITKWEGTAARNFERDVIPKHGTSVVHQLVFIEELIAVAKCLQEVMLRYRADGLGLAQDLLDKVTLDEVPVDWETVLWVAGSIAAGIATFGALVPVSATAVAGAVGYAVSTASGAIGAVKKLSGGGTEDRSISGDTAYDFIPSCVDQVQKAFGVGVNEVEAIMDALKSDLDSPDIDYLTISKPKVIDGAEMDLIDAENQSEGTLVESVADLRYAGAVTLQVMAEYFDKAYGEVANLTYPFDAGMGKSEVTNTPSMRHLATAIETLSDGLKDTRDYLYKAGVALTDIADAYFDNEEQQKAVMDNFNGQLGEFDEEAYPRYSPGSGSPSTDR